MVQPYQNNDYPVPAELRNTYVEELGLVPVRNDEEAWHLACQWMSGFKHWTHYDRSAEAKPGHGLVLYGPVGTGKTSIASAFINLIARDVGFSVAFVPDGMLAHMFRFRWRESETDDQVLRLQRLGVVVIDDLLRQGTQRDPGDVETFIRMRYNNGLPTIITVNSGVTLPDTLRSFLRTWTWCMFEGKDLRDPDHLAAVR